MHKLYTLCIRLSLKVVAYQKEHASIKNNSITSTFFCVELGKHFVGSTYQHYYIQNV